MERCFFHGLFLASVYTTVPVGKVELASSLGSVGTRTVNNGLVVRFD